MPEAPGRSSRLLLLLLWATLRTSRGALPPCRDQQRECAEWAEQAECLANPYFMRATCTAACNVRLSCYPERRPAPWAGHATAEGTALYANTYIGAVHGASGFRHYRLDTAMGEWLPPGHRMRSDPWLTLSSLGTGTYLGAEDDATDELVTCAVLQSVHQGLNVVDTARNYRGGRGERAVGEALDVLFASKEGLVRGMLFVSTKAGFATPGAAGLISSGKVSEAELASGHCIAPACLEASLQESLAALNLATVDLLYLHNAAEMQLGPLGKAAFLAQLRAAFSWLEGARAQGRIRAYGMATWECFRKWRVDDPGALQLLEVVRLAEEVGGRNHGFRYIQLPVSAAMREAVEARGQEVEVDGRLQRVSVLEAAARLGVSVFGSGPLAEGQLLSEQAGGRLRDLLSRQEALRPLEAWPAKLLQVARSTPLLLATLVGHKRPPHVQQNLQLALTAPLTGEQYRALFEPLRTPEAVTSA